MRFNVRIENEEVCAQNSPDRTISQAMALAVDGMAAGMDVHITQIIETVKGEESEIQKKARRN